jgi:hypothetical protein
MAMVFLKYTCQTLESPSLKSGREKSPRREELSL